MKCETCTYNEYCADVGVSVIKAEECEHYVPVCESCKINYDDETKEDN